jgi:hypothetical protein
MRLLAQDREQWREIVQNVTLKYCESREEKVTKERELKKKAGCLAEAKRDRREEKKWMEKVFLNRLHLACMIGRGFILRLTLVALIGVGS